MLPDILLDNENYDKILENAKNMIVSIYPEWTDFNYHDPGVTMLELFAWLKESQQYYLNKIGPENRQKYLKLMGVFRLHKAPAKTDVTILYDEDIIVAEGTKFYAGDLPFEAEKRTYIPSARIISCISSRGSDFSVIGSSELSFGGNLRIQPFSKNEPKNSAFYIGLSKSLPVGEELEFLITMGDDGGVARNPVSDSDEFIPLCNMEVCFFNGTSWEKADILRDTTYAFLLSGRITIRVPGEMMSCSIKNEDAFYLRFSITDGEYDTQPSIESIDFNYAPLLQQDTKALSRDFSTDAPLTQANELAVLGKTRLFLKDGSGLYTEITDFVKMIDEETGEVTYSDIDMSGSFGLLAVSYHSDFYSDGAFGTGTGLPYQEYDLGSENIDYDSFSIMTSVPGSGGKFAKWKKVNDFSGSGPADFHYIFDSDKGIIRFGDSIHGTAPEGTILITGYKLTAGSASNVAKNKVNRLSGFDSDTVTVFNNRPAHGGRDEESFEQCLARAHELLRTTETMVSTADYEKRILSTPGLRIEKCQVVNMNKDTSQKKFSDIVTSVVVKPYCENGRGVPSRRYIENILRYTDHYRMMGTRLAIVTPDYADITLFADINVSFGSTNAKKLISDAVNSYFNSIKDDFGTQISYRTLYTLIDRLDCVLSINTLTIDASGSDMTRTREGDLLLSPNVTAILADTDYIINTVY